MGTYSPLTTENREKAYRDLILDVKKFYETQEELHKDEPVYLTWCKDCKEINLWTYWQGQGNLSAEILLVGQDWGSLEQNPQILQNIRAINDGLRTDYHHDPDSKTDCNLVELFRSIGIHIDNGIRDRRLFFTNFVLGYRNHGLTGGFKDRWIRENECFFLRLGEIIEPGIIICLGRSVFLGVTRALGKTVRLQKYNEYLTSSQNPVSVTLPSGRETQIFATAHCGVIGTLNRNRPKDPSCKDGFELQKEDWARIATYLISHNESPEIK